MKCPRIHRYVIALTEGQSEVYDTPEEALAFKKTAPDSLWVAFHEVGIKQLVDHPDTIETYCATETQRLEAEDQHADDQLTFDLTPGVNLTKRS